MKRYIPLHRHECDSFAANGEVLVICPVEPQPTESFGFFFLVGDNGFEVEVSDGLDPVPDMLAKTCCFGKPGDSVVLDTTAGLPPEVPSFAPACKPGVISNVKLCRLDQFSQDDRKAAGCTALMSVFVSRWDHYNPRHPAEGNPWAWAALIRRKD